MSTKKAIAYYRTAAANPEAINEQKAKARAFAETAGMEITNEFVDDGFAAHALGRPAWQEVFNSWLLQPQSEVKYLLMRDISRIDRFDPGHPYKVMLGNLCKDNKWQVVFFGTSKIDYVHIGATE